MSVSNARSRISLSVVRRQEPAVLAAVALLAVGFLFLLYATRHVGFFSDEWDIILARHDLSLDALLRSHNGHMTLVPVAIYQLLFLLFGIDSYLPYRVALIGLHVAACGAVFVLARRRIGGPAALVPMVLLLFLGTAYEDLLWAFQVTLVGSIAFGLLALVLLDRDSPRANAGAAVLLFASLASSGIGVAFLAGAIVELLLRRRPRRLWVVAAPGLLYAAWYLGYGGDQQGASQTNLVNAPQYVMDAAAGAAASIGGMTYTWGAPLLLFGIVAVWAMRHAQGVSAPLSPRFAALATIALVNWGLTALTRGHIGQPAASRYLYAGAALLLLLAVESLRAPRRDARIAVVALILTGAAVLSNVGELRDGQRLLRSYAVEVRAAITAAQIAGDTAPSELRPVVAYSPQITVGQYLDAVEAIGSSPAIPAAELPQAPEFTRDRVDRILETMFDPGIEQVPGRPGAEAGSRPPAVLGSAYGTVSVRRACLRFTPSGPGAAIELTVAPGAILSLEPAAGQPQELRLRRYADRFPASPTTTLPPEETTRVAFPDDTDPSRPWQVRVDATQPLLACQR